MSKQLEWEEIESPGHAGYFWRSRTPTGWLVREIQQVSHMTQDQGLQSGWDFQATITFVPDPDGTWLKEGNK